MVLGKVQNLYGTETQLLILDGNVLMLTRTHVKGDLGLSQVGLFGGAWLEGDTQPVTIRLDVGQYGNPIMWGTASFGLTNGSALIVAGDTATNALKLTGGYTIDASSNAWPWDPVDNIYAEPVAITPAHVDSETSLSNPATGTRIFLAN